MLNKINCHLPNIRKAFHMTTYVQAYRTSDLEA
jgi:hypothetical protein